MRLAVVLAVALILFPVGARNVGRAQGADDVTVRPVRVVILVDESTSISKDDLQRERDAAALIALGEFAPGSVMSIVGFAAENGKPGQTPVDVVCPPTSVATAQDRQFLAECVTKLHRRTDEEGDGTDHASALSQALGYLRPGTEPKIVFLLTDGRLNVENSPSYGVDNVDDRRNQAARAKIRELLSTAAATGVQIWPLGFGKVDESQLRELAGGGSQRTCGSDTPKPTVRTVGTAADVVKAMLQAFGAARCAGVGPFIENSLSSGQTVEARVEIPPIATDGSIIVMKHDARVSVSYADPNGNVVPKSGKANNSTFQVSGENGPVEALRVVNPEPGEWRVRISSAPDLPTQNVGTVVTWQGAVRAALDVDPTAPGPGQTVTVNLRVQTRNRAIDARQLQGLSFTAELAGDGFAPVPVSLGDSGVNGDAKAGDGLFSGLVTVPPTANGALRFTGRVSGVGISGDERLVNTWIPPLGPPPVRAQVRLSQDGAPVAPGASLRGTVSVTNASDQSHRLRLLADKPAPGVNVTVDPAVYEVAASSTADLSFVLKFAGNTALGPNTATLTLVDEANPAIPLHVKPFTAIVGYPPSVWKRLWWLWIVLSIVVIAGVVSALLVLRARARRRDVRGLVVELLRGNRRVGYLSAPDVPGAVFAFALRTNEGVPRVIHTDGFEACYRLSRRGGGLVRIETPEGDVHVLSPDQRVDVEPGLALGVRDERLAATADEDATSLVRAGESATPPDDTLL